MAKYIENKPIQDGSIDAGLFLLEKVGVLTEYTTAEIAFVCGVERQTIQAYEVSAKRKLKRLFEEKGIDAQF